MSENLELVERVNKTQVKREVVALVDLGKSIASLSKDQFEAMPLSDSFRQAIVDARKLSKGAAIKRQFKYIGKLLRDMGDEAELLFAALDKQLDKDRSAATRLHMREKWRDRLVEGGDAELREFVRDHPAADRQHIRQLQRKAKRELESQKPPAAARKIFQYIKKVTIMD